MRPPFVIPSSVSSFHDYFRLTAESDVVAGALGYQFEPAQVVLPRADQFLPWVEPLLRRLDTARLHVNITNETARREFLIAPVLLELVEQYAIRLRIEFPLSVNDQLRGSLDYLVEGVDRLLVIEAKDENIARGTTQLVAELVALDQWLTNEPPVLYGAVSTGTLWQFVVLHRTEKRMVQDVNAFRVPQDLVELCAVLLGILGLPAIPNPA